MSNGKVFNAINYINTVRAQRQAAAATVALKVKGKPKLVKPVIDNSLKWWDIKEKKVHNFGPIVSDEVFIQVTSHFLGENDNEIGGFMWWDEDIDEITWQYRDSDADESSSGLRADDALATVACLEDLDEVPNVMWHTHPMFGASFSSTDTDTMTKHLDEARTFAPSGGKFMWICIDRLCWDVYLIEWGPEGLTKTRGNAFLSTGYPLDTDDGYSQLGKGYASYGGAYGAQPVYPSQRTHAPLPPATNLGGDTDLYRGRSRTLDAYDAPNEDDYYDSRYAAYERVPQGSNELPLPRRPFDQFYEPTTLCQMDDKDLLYYKELFIEYGCDLGDWSDLKDTVIAQHGSEIAWVEIIDDPLYWGSIAWEAEAEWSQTQGI